MTPEKRLNQLEPVVAEVLAQMDRVTAQNRQIITTVIQNSDDIQFLLRETSVIKQDVSDLKEGQIRLEQDVSGLKQDVSGLKQDVSGLKQDVSGLKQDVSGLKQGMSELGQKLDLVLQLLKSGNGK